MYFEFQNGFTQALFLIALDLDISSSNAYVYYYDIIYVKVSN